MANLPVAVQLYTVREASAADFPSTLRKVAEIGYKSVEFAGFNGLAVNRIKTVLSDLGLSVVAAHVGIDALVGDQAEKTFVEYKSIGCPYVVVPYLAEDKRGSAAAYKKVAATLNKIAESSKAYGLKVGYHNHGFEFQDVYDGVSGEEILINETDPALVSFELDTYWALFAGQDPVAFLNKYPGRFALLHIKDMNPDDRSFAEVGTGILPLDAIIAAAPAAGATALIVEQDVCKRNPLESIEISYNNMKAKGYV